MELQNKRVAIFIEDLFDVFEFWYPYYRLKEAGAEVLVVAPEAGRAYSGKSGTQARSDAAAGDTSAANFDALLIPGGYAPDRMRRHEAMVGLLREMHRTGKIVAAICHAGWMLASAGILAGRTVTSFFSIRDDMINAGAEWVDREAVRDGNLITSRKPDDLPVFMQTVIKAVEGG
jgi:protease I